MLRYKGKKYTEEQLKYFSFINYNHVNNYLYRADETLESIDADLPTNKELIEQRKRYNKLSKEYERRLRKQQARSVLNPHYLYEKQISVWEDKYDIYVIDRDGSLIKWDRDTYEHFRDKKGFKFKHVSKL
jgi:hypothetical protein